MKILIPEFMLAEPVARLRAVHDVHYEPTLIDYPDKLIALAAGADCLIIRNRTQVRGALLDAMQACRLIGRLGVGLDNIDVETCKARGIHVVPAVGANARSVAEYVVTTAMMLLRGAYLVTQDVAAGKWPRNSLANGQEASQRQLGIIGLGSIGRVTAELGRSVGMRVAAYSRNLGKDAAAGWPLLSMEQLLETSDVISLHVPLTPETRGLINAEKLSRMKRGAILINTARGSIVDNHDLVEALRSGHLGGAALDVFNTEPLAAGSIFAGVPNLLLTPHIAGVTQDSEVRVGNLIADKVLELLH